MANCQLHDHIAPYICGHLHGKRSHGESEQLCRTVSPTEISETV